MHLFYITEYELNIAQKKKNTDSSVNAKDVSWSNSAAMNISLIVLSATIFMVACFSRYLYKRCYKNELLKTSGIQTYESLSTLVQLP